MPLWLGSRWLWTWSIPVSRRVTSLPRRRICAPGWSYRAIVVRRFSREASAWRSWLPFNASVSARPELSTVPARASRSGRRTSRQSIGWRGGLLVSSSWWPTRKGSVPAGGVLAQRPSDWLHGSLKASLNSSRTPRFSGSGSARPKTASCSFSPPTHVAAGVLPVAAEIGCGSPATISGTRPDRPTVARQAPPVSCSSMSKGLLAEEKQTADGAIEATNHADSPPGRGVGTRSDEAVTVSLGH
ncbi:hypothetical protein QFZ33_002173 [Arthrobacter globiformis]|nr:hypothetical protein [Arthrobacter globiformis]